MINIRELQINTVSPESVISSRVKTIEPKLVPLYSALHSLFDEGFALVAEDIKRIHVSLGGSALTNRSDLVDAAKLAIRLDQTINSRPYRGEFVYSFTDTENPDLLQEALKSIPVKATRRRPVRGFYRK